MGKNGKLKNYDEPQRFSAVFKVSKDLLSNAGCFDVDLSKDSPLYIDPKCLDSSSSHWFSGSYKKISDYFSYFVGCLDHENVDSYLFGRALSFIKVGELSGLCLGNTKNGIIGSGIGEKTADQVVRNGLDIIKAGGKNPALFEMLPSFEEGVGVDMISDLLGVILIDEIVGYNKELIQRFRLSEETSPLYFCNREEQLLENPFFKGTPVLLLPKDILSDMPLFGSFEDIDVISRNNERVRASLNSFIDYGSHKKLSLSEKKNQILCLLKTNSDFRELLVSSYQEGAENKYDFDQDPKNLFLADAVEENTFFYAEKHDLRAHLRSFANAAELAMQLCYDFKRVIEEEGEADLVRGKSEVEIHRIFRIHCRELCRAYEVCFDPESNSGNGPVDFKLSHGSADTCLVEIKLLTNPGLIDGLKDEGQLDVYLENHESSQGIYLVLGENDLSRLDKLHQFYNGLSNASQKRKKLIVIDDSKRTSASNR